MDAEEEEPHHVPKVESSLRLEDNPATTDTNPELPHGDSELQCQVEPVAELDPSQPPAPSEVSPVAENEEEGGGKGTPEVVVRDEEGDDMIAGEGKHEISDACDEVKAPSPVAVDREESHLANEEEQVKEKKADIVEDAAVIDVMEETEKADVSDARGAEGIEVVGEEQQAAKETEILEEKVVDDMHEQIDVPKEKQAADVAEERRIAEAAEVVDGATLVVDTHVADLVKERGIAEAAEVDDKIEQTVVTDEIVLADETEKTGIVEERELPVGRRMLEEEHLDNEVEQTGNLEETGVGDIVDKTNLLKEEPVDDVSQQTGIVGEIGVINMVEEKELPKDKLEVNFKGTGVVDMVEKSETLEEKIVANLPEQTEILENINAVRETGTDIAEEEKDIVVGEESEKAEDTETENVVEDVEKAEGTETEMGDVAEGMDAADDTEMLDMTEEAEEAAEETEDAEEAEETSIASGGKRKRAKNSNSKVLARAPSRKKVEEDVCFVCFDGGDLVLCDRRGCPKAYHTSCVGRDEAFFQSKGKWNCGWHLCSNCKKNAHYMCYTCTFSLCKGCIKDAVILCVRGNKGLCESCMNLIMLIERNEQAQVNFDDKNSWEYLFKDYWIDLKRRLSITSDELAQAKNPWKGSEHRAAKQESPNDDVGGSGSDGSSGNAEVTVSKRRKTRSQSKSRARLGDSPTDENAEWASKELLEVVMHMRNGDKSVLSRMELSQLILDYIQKHKLRDRRNKSYVICDSRLKNLFGKPRVGHIEMLNLLDPHIFFTKEDSQTDELQESVVDAETNQLDADWNSDAMAKTGKDKKRKSRKKGDARGLQSNLDDYAAIDMHNINLIYLRRNLVEDLIEDPETFHDKVVGSFVRIRISGAGQKQDLYRLVQVVGTSKVAEPYRVGKKTTDFLLEILNLNKTEVVSIDIISNQEFTEDECKRLRQSIKCGLINRLTVGDIQEKAIAIQAVRVKDWLESEIMRLSHLRDRASEKGRRKELRECVEKLQVLKTPEERQRRLEENPEIHVDPKMDPSYESEEDEGEEDKKQDNYLRPRGSSFSRRGREPISPRKGGFSSSDSWSGSRNYSSMNRELGRNLSNKGFTSKGDDPVGVSETGNEPLWSLGRERETQQTNSWDKPKAAFSSESGLRNTHTVVIPEPSLKVASESLPTPLSKGVAAGVQINETEKVWHYQDPSGKVQGPFSMVQLRKWSNTGYFPAELKIWRATEKQEDSILLTDALAGKFQKDPPVVDNSFPKAQTTVYGNSIGATLKQGVESQVGERSRFDQNLVAWSPQRTLGSSGQSPRESWKSQTEVGSSTDIAASSLLEIPKYSRDAWSSDTNLPSPTPNQNTTSGTKGQAFESKWSPTPAQSSGSLSIANPFRGGSAGLQPPTVVSDSGSPAAPVVHSHMVSGELRRTQVHAQASINPGVDMKNAGVSLQNLVQPVSSHNPSDTHGWGSGPVSRQEAVAASSIPASANQAWGNASAQKLEPSPSLSMPSQPAAYGHWNDASQSGQNSAPFSTPNPAGGFRTPAQPAMLASDSWRPTVPVHSNVQHPAPANLPWGTAVADNQGAALRQAPGNQNTGWGPMPGNQNMAWAAPVPANSNVNWAASGQGSASVNPNPSWAAPSQGQVPGNANSGWTAPGNAMQAWAPPGQAPGGVNASSGWVAPGQGLAVGSGNPGYAAPSGNSGMWGGEQNHNGDKFSNQRDRGSQGGDPGYGGVKPWSRQSSFGAGGGSSRSPFKGQRVCKFHENGHCKKGASCDYMHT